MIMRGRMAKEERRLSLEFRAKFKTCEIVLPSIKEMKHSKERPLEKYIMHAGKQAHIYIFMESR